MIGGKYPVFLVVASVFRFVMAHWHIWWTKGSLNVAVEVAVPRGTTMSDYFLPHLNSAGNDTTIS